MKIISSIETRTWKAIKYDDGTIYTVGVILPCESGDQLPSEIKKFISENKLLY